MNDNINSLKTYKIIHMHRTAVGYMAAKFTKKLTGLAHSDVHIVCL